MSVRCLTKKCEESGVTLTFSSPYHHQANGVAERCVGTTKALWKKAAENNQCPETALWMYRITPLDDHLPSPYELLYGRKPRSPLPTSNLALQSRHLWYICTPAYKSLGTSVPRLDVITSDVHVQFCSGPPCARDSVVCCVH